VGSVAPTAVTCPSGDNTTAPTHGFGDVDVRTAAAAPNARRIVASSITDDAS
jgi:hypothetical protein